jgi:hypothetical protein
MYPSGSDDLFGGIWSTQITELITTARPWLTIAPAGTNVKVSWPAAFGGYQLWSAPNLASPASWSQVGQTTATNSGQISVLLPASSVKQFFRLQQM